MAEIEALVIAIKEHIDGWASANYAWQVDPDPVVSERNKAIAEQAHAAECIRRIRAEFVSYDAKENSNV